MHSTKQGDFFFLKFEGGEERVKNSFSFGRKGFGEIFHFCFFFFLKKDKVSKVFRKKF